MKKVAIYGGAFDPPHFGHVTSVRNVLCSGLVDEVWIAPSSDLRYDKSASANAGHRRAMLEIEINNSFKEDGRVKLDLSQLINPEDRGYAVELLDDLSLKYPENKYFFIVGADNLQQIKSWYKSERLLREYDFIVVPRPDSKPIRDFHEYKNFHFLDESKVIKVDVSSSELRQKLSSRNSFKDVGENLITQAVYEYIVNNNLYLSDA